MFVINNSNADSVTKIVYLANEVFNTRTLREPQKMLIWEGYNQSALSLPTLTQWVSLHGSESHISIDQLKGNVTDQRLTEFFWPMPT